MEVSKPVRAKNAKPPVARPAVYKKGVWNPDIELITEERGKQSRESDFDSGSSLLSNTRNVLSAAWTGNKALLDKCIQDTQRVPNCCA